MIDLKPDLFILAYGLNDMRGGMAIKDFRDDMATIIRDVKKACDPLTVLTTIYYMTGYGSGHPSTKEVSPSPSNTTNAFAVSPRSSIGILADVWQAEGGANWLIHYDDVDATW